MKHMGNSQSEILRADDLYHVYDTEAIDGNVVALRGVHLRVNQGEVVSIVGPSGAGKSTLMKCLGGLMKASAGDVFFEGKSIAKVTPEELLKLRQETVSFIFQNANLLPYMTILNNVAMPLKYMRVGPRSARHEAMELLDRLGIKDQAKKLPNQISGGEKQRTAIARALITKPKIILADEPTGSVDPVTSREILDLFREAINETGVSFLIVTHNREVAKFADRSLELVDGRFIAEHGSGINVFNLAGTRRIIVDSAGNVALPPELLSEMGGPGTFRVGKVDHDRISLERIRPTDPGRAPDRAEARTFCTACKKQYTNSAEEACSKCGALRPR